MKDGAPVVPRAKPQSYYGRPVLKRPVWTWEIPTYFFAGGMAGASAPLALASRGNPALARRAALVALGGIAVSPPLLISDLGRPERFYRMLRVVKPTSPMSVGTWVVSVFGLATALATPWHFGYHRGRGAAVASAALGPIVSTYTAVLVAQTSVPVWHDARHTLPFVFAGSSLASAGGAAAALTPAASAGPARALAIAGAALELAAEARMTRALDPRVRSAYEHETVKPVHRAARACTAAGAALMLARRPRTGGALLCAGSALERLAVIRAGRASAADPAATIGPQRDRVRAGA